MLGRPLQEYSLTRESVQLPLWMTGTAVTDTAGLSRLGTIM